MLRVGLMGGAVLALLTAVFAILGLTPSLRWIPEAPLLAAALFVPLATLVATGARAYVGTAHVTSALLAGALAGAIGGVAGGLSYVAYGKPVMNVAGGLVAGVVGGALCGLIGALWSRRFIARQIYAQNLKVFCIIRSKSATGTVQSTSRC